MAKIKHESEYIAEFKDNLTKKHTKATRTVTKQQKEMIEAATAAAKALVKDLQKSQSDHNTLIEANNKKIVALKKNYSKRLANIQAQDSAKILSKLKATNQTIAGIAKQKNAQLAKLAYIHTKSMVRAETVRNNTLKSLQKDYDSAKISKSKFAHARELAIELAANQKKVARAKASTVNKIVAAQARRRTQILREELKKQAADAKAAAAEQRKANSGGGKSGGNLLSGVYGGGTAKGFLQGFSKLGPVALGVSAALKLANLSIQSVTRSIQFLAQATIQSVKDAAQFEQSMANIAAIVRPTSDGFGILEAKARSLGETTVFTATQSAEAFLELGKLGLRTNEIIEASADTLNLAAASGATMQKSALLLGKTLKQYSLDASETGRLTDVMTRAFSTSALNIDTFSSTMRYAGTIAKAAGADFETTAAALSTMSNKGIESSISGTALRRMMTELSSATSKVSKFLSDKGVPATASFSEKIKALGGELTKFTSQSQIDALKHFFGQYAVAGSAALLQSTEEFGAFIKDFKENSKGFAETTAEMRLDTLLGDMDLLKSATQEMGITLLKAFGTTPREFIQQLIDRVKDIKTWVLDNGPAVKALSDAFINMANNVAKTVDVVWKPFKLLLEGIAEIKRGLNGGSVETFDWNDMKKSNMIVNDYLMALIKLRNTKDSISEGSNKSITGDDGKTYDAAAIIAREKLLEVLEKSSPLAGMSIPVLEEAYAIDQLISKYEDLNGKKNLQHHRDLDNDKKKALAYRAELKAGWSVWSIRKKVAESELKTLKDKKSLNESETLTLQNLKEEIALGKRLEKNYKAVRLINYSKSPTVDGDKVWTAPKSIRGSGGSGDSSGSRSQFTDFLEPLEKKTQKKNVALQERIKLLSKVSEWSKAIQKSESEATKLKDQYAKELKEKKDDLTRAEKDTSISKTDFNKMDAKFDERALKIKKNILQIERSINKEKSISNKKFREETKKSYIAYNTSGKSAGNTSSLFGGISDANDELKNAKKQAKAIFKTQKAELDDYYIKKAAMDSGYNADKAEIEKQERLAKIKQSYRLIDADLERQHTEKIFDQINKGAMHLQSTYSMISATASNLHRIEEIQLESKFKSRQDRIEKQRKSNSISARMAVRQEADNIKMKEEAERKLNQKKKQWAISDAVINGAVAITNIWKSWAGNPVVAGLLTTASFAQTASQISFINAQNYATGGSPVGKNALVQMNERGQEGILNHAAYTRLGGRKNLDALNAGKTLDQIPSQQNQIVNQTFVYSPSHTFETQTNDVSVVEALNQDKEGFQKFVQESRERGYSF